MPDARPLASPETPATSRALPRLIVPAVLVAIAAGVVVSTAAVLAMKQFWPNRAAEEAAQNVAV